MGLSDTIYGVMLSTKYTDKTASNSNNNLGIWIFYSYPTYLKLVEIFEQLGEISVKECDTLVKHFKNQRPHLVALHFRTALQIHSG